MSGRITATCCITGGRLADILFGHLLARAAIDVLVLEQHRDFLGDFHGDSIHPAVPGAMDELWLLTGLSG